MNESPPGNGTGARQGADPQNESDTKQLPDSALIVNQEIRELIRSKDGVLCFEVRGPRNRRRFEIIVGDRCLRYPLYYSASNKFDRIIRNKRGTQQ